MSNNSYFLSNNVTSNLSVVLLVSSRLEKCVQEQLWNRDSESLLINDCDKTRLRNVLQSE